MDFRKKNFTGDGYTWDSVDEPYFDSMVGHYVSERERDFFEKMRLKQNNILTWAGEVILDARNNDAQIFFCRYYHNEYKITYGLMSSHRVCYVQNLKAAMQTSMKDVPLIERDITFHEWLRETDYKGVDYNHSFDED